MHRKTENEKIEIIRTHQNWSKISIAKTAARMWVAPSFQDRTAMATPAVTITAPAARLSRRTERFLVNILRAQLAK
jgi:hypothetical protein